MKRIVTITDLTRMQQQRVCIAGHLPDDTCVRPVFRQGGGIPEGWLRLAGQVVVRPFARVELDLQEHTPEPPHTEDWILNPLVRVQRGMLAPGDRRALLARLDDRCVGNIFGARIQRDPGCFIRTGEGKRSLGTVKAVEISEVAFGLKDGERWDYRLMFTDGGGEPYRLAVTDLAFRCYLDCLRTKEGLSPTEAAHRLTGALRQAEVFLRIGLARHWDRYPDRCYLQITGVHSFPDYLEGRCFADLIP